MVISEMHGLQYTVEMMGVKNTRMLILMHPQYVNLWGLSTSDHLSTEHQCKQGKEKVNIVD